MKRFFADANIFLRFLIGDVPSQLEKVKGYFDQARQNQIEIIVSTVVFFEVIYVLRGKYGHLKIDIIESMGNLLSVPFLNFEEEETLKSVLVMWTKENLDLVDCYSKIKAESFEAEILTFDKRISRRAS